MGSSPVSGVADTGFRRYPVGDRRLQHDYFSTRTPAHYLRDSRYYCVGHGPGLSGEFSNIPHLSKGMPYPLDGVLEAGMVICIESYISCAHSGQGVKLEEQLLITETGV